MQKLARHKVHKVSLSIPGDGGRILLNISGTYSLHDFTVQKRRVSYEQSAPRIQSELTIKSQLVLAEARRDKALSFSCFHIGMNYQLPADCVHLYREVLTSVIL
jgi:hypothetical protein